MLALKLVTSISVGTWICRSVTGAAETEEAPRSRRDEIAATVFIFNGLVDTWVVGMLEFVGDTGGC